LGVSVKDPLPGYQIYAIFTRNGHVENHIRKTHFHLIFLLEQSPSDQLVALAFAQHYAEQADHPDEPDLQRLQDSYGPQATSELLASISLIYFANLLGNTFDKLLHHFKPAALPRSSS
jgi:hypothetical protein